MVRLIILCLLGISVWLWLPNAPAQDAPILPPNLTNPTEKRNEITIQRAPLDTIVVFDSEGSPRLLPGGWSLTLFDEIHEYFRRNHQNPVPPFILRNVSATGTITENYVAADVQIQFSTSTYQPTRIPLGFKEGILPDENLTNRPAFRYTGPGSAELSVDPQEGYIAIVVPQTQKDTNAEEGADVPEKPAVVQQHTLSLLFWFPLGPTGGNDNRLSLSFPQANISQFLLDVPTHNLTATVTQGSIINIQENADQQSTRLSVQGLRKDTEITWSKKKIDVADDRPELLVEGATIDARLDVRSTVYDAILPVNSATGSFEQLRIRLPQGCVLDREMTDRYAVAGDYSVGDTDGESIVVVQFPRKVTGNVSIRLRATQYFEVQDEKPDFKRDLAGFEVLGAERQQGFLTVSVSPSELKPHWELVRGVRRTEGTSTSTGVTTPTPTIPTTSTGSTRFGFVSQPFQLSVRATSPQTRINVKPEYQFHISKGMVSMTARLSYTVSGSKANSLDIFLADPQWQHYDFGTSNIIDIDAVVSLESGLLKIPLRNPMDGPIEIEFRAARPIAPGDEKHRIVLPIPQPDVPWSEPAWITITSENSVEVLPIDESSSVPSEQRTHGLTRQSRRVMPVRTDLTGLQQEPLVYRTEPTGAEFVADLVYHQRKINAVMRTNVQLFAENNQVTQMISYNAAYVPVSRLSFLIPKALDTGDIQVHLENRTLELRDTSSDPRDYVPENWVRKVIQLPEPMFRFELTFRYPPPQFTVPADSTTLFSLPLICPSPTEVPVSDHRIHFSAPPEYNIELQDESKQSWESFPEPSRPLAGVTETFRSALSPMRIALLVSVSEKSVSETTIVERAWLQTWLMSGMRVDRASYRLKSTSDSVTLRLPPDSLREGRVIVRVDDQ
jgi:hypothetical protein